VQTRRVIEEKGDGAAQPLVNPRGEISVAREAIDDRIGGHGP
jgi:hypothetical protein